LRQPESEEELKRRESRTLIDCKE